MASQLLEAIWAKCVESISKCSPAGVRKDPCGEALFPASLALKGGRGFTIERTMISHFASLASLHIKTVT